MARKNILEGLMTGKKAAPATPAEGPLDPARPRATTGAIGAVSRSIAELKSRSMIEIDPFAIEGAGLEDRLGALPEDDAALRDSLREYGQQVPILVRPHPSNEGKYQIVYGRRRVLALRDLGLPVKALVRDLEDRDLIVAQGQENTARRDLTFIEKANFARQMVEHGFERKVICDTLSIDKTLISRMLAVAEAVPLSLIQKIGPAQGIGRERWLALAELCRKAEEAGIPRDEPTMLAHGETSESRFEAAFAYLSRSQNAPAPKAAAPALKSPASETITTQDGAPLALLKRTGNARSFKIDETEFADWLAEALPALHAQWRKNPPTQ